MNFFKSILSDDPDPIKSENPHETDSDSSNDSNRGDRSSNDMDQDQDEEDQDQDNTAGAWSFGGLMKTIATRSESVIETYRRDLEEFGSGLKKETEIIREVASRAVKELPTSIEAGASAAQGALDGVLKSTAEIISKEAMLFSSDGGEPETPEASRSFNSGRYSWFDSQLSAMQSDLNTFCEEPEDFDEYKKWKLGFGLEGKQEEIEGLIGENGVLEGIYVKVVPSVVDDGTFWCRYFYRLDKLQQQERVRGNLVKRAISIDDDEELSWDVDDDDEEDVKGVGNTDEQTSDVKVKGEDKIEDKGVSDGSLNQVQKQQEASSSASQDDLKKEGGNLDVVDSADNNEVKDPIKESSEVVSSGDKEAKSVEEVAELKKRDEEVMSKENVNKNDEKAREEVKVETVKKNDSAVETSNQSKDVEEEDLGWDEIEDLGSGDEKKSSATTSNPNRAELKKRLSTEDDDEDLSWDIEDDDEPVKA